MNPEYRLSATTISIHSQWETSIRQRARERAAMPKDSDKATCTNCGQQIEYRSGTRNAWVHTNPQTPNPECCTTIAFATPKRGSIRRINRCNIPLNREPGALSG